MTRRGKQVGRQILPKVIRGDLMEEAEYLTGLQDEFQREKGGSNLPKLKNEPEQGHRWQNKV